jgi:hypothetical protein
MAGDAPRRHHAVTNHRIEIDGDVASIRAHIQAQHWLPPDLAVPDHNRWLVVGFYDGEALRTPDGWRLTAIRLTATYQEHPQPLADGAAAPMS